MTGNHIKSLSLYIFVCMFDFFYVFWCSKVSRFEMFWFQAWAPALAAAFGWTGMINSDGDLRKDGRIKRLVFREEWIERIQGAQTRCLDLRRLWIEMEVPRFEWSSMGVSSVGLKEMKHGWSWESMTEHGLGRRITGWGCPPSTTCSNSTRSPLKPRTPDLDDRLIDKE